MSCNNCNNLRHCGEPSGVAVARHDLCQWPDYGECKEKSYMTKDSIREWAKSLRDACYRERQFPEARAYRSCNICPQKTACIVEEHDGQFPLSRIDRDSFDKAYDILKSGLLVMNPVLKFDGRTAIIEVPVTGKRMAIITLPAGTLDVI